ncbi:MAG: MFS transporter [Gammaproteobacteria bacterium]
MNNVKDRRPDYRSPQAIGHAGRKELIAWAFYDFANSGYTTVVQTTIFSTYFVGVVAGGADGVSNGLATLLWSISVGFANFIVMLSAPVVGAIADYRASKKRYLLFSSVGCILTTAMLAAVGPGDIVPGMTLVTISVIMFAYGENLVAAFLPELVPEDRMGRLSGYGWSLGYFGGLLTLLLCLGYIVWAKQQGWTEAEAVPATMLITAGVFALTAAPTFIWLKERAKPVAADLNLSVLSASFRRLRHTYREAKRFQDLFSFLITLAVYQSGVSTVIVLAAIYAQEVMGFDTQSLIVLIMVINVTAAVGALICGQLQDRIGSAPTLAITLVIWIAALVAAFLATEKMHMWFVGNMMGLAMGSSQAVGRALVSKFSPADRAGEFLGLWGLVNRLSVIIGPLSYGLINYWSDGNHRLSLLSTLLFFVVGLLLLRSVDEARGRAAVNQPRANVDG